MFHGNVKPFAMLIAPATFSTLAHALVAGAVTFSLASLSRLDRGGLRRWWWVRNPSLLQRSRLLTPAAACIACWGWGIWTQSPLFQWLAAFSGVATAVSVGTGIQAFIAQDDHRRKVEIRHWEMRKPAEYRLAHQAKMQKRELDRVQDEALRSLMDPHFLFNALNGIVHDLIQSKQSRAIRHLKAFNRLAERQIQSGQEGWIRMADQWESLQDYIELEVRRLDRPISTSLEPLARPLCDIRIPSLMVQPLVENALWHGLGGTSSQSGGSLIIVARPLDAQHVVVEIRNSISAASSSFPAPVGPETRWTNRRHAMDLIRHRLNLLDRTGPSSLSIQRDGPWTVARIVLPFRLSATG